MSEIERCKHEGYGGDVWSRRKVRCQFKAKTEDGYCKRHDPDIRAEKTKKRDAKWRAELEERDQVSRVRAKEREALEVVKRIATGVEDPTGTARSFIKELDALIAEGKKGDNEQNP